jgi:hypothetical protein
MEKTSHLKQFCIIIFVLILNINILTLEVKGLKSFSLDDTIIKQTSLFDPPPNGSYIEIKGGWSLHVLLIARNGSIQLPWQFWVNSSCPFRQPNEQNKWRFYWYENGSGITLHIHSVLFLYAIGTFTVDAIAGDVKATAQGTFFRCGRFLEWWFVQKQNQTILV